MRIQFKQQGGAMPPYISYRPFVPVSSTTSAAETTQPATTTAKQSSDEGLKDKDLMTMLKDIDGLPNDMQVVISNLKSMYDLQTIAPSAATGLVSMYLNSLLKSKTANFNKKQYDNAYKEVNDNKGLSEVAISDRGKVFATDENNKPYELSIEEYVKNPDKYRLLTNSNLLYLRAHSPSFAFQNEVFSIVENGLGMEKVAEFLKDNLQTLGTDESNRSYNVFTKNQQVIDGAEVLKGLAAGGYRANTSIDGLYQANVITKSQAKQAEAALKYLYQILPDNAKNLIRVKAAKMGLTEEKGINELLSDLVLSKVTSSSTINFEYKGAYDKDGTDKNAKGSSSSISSDDVKVNVPTQFVAGLGQDSMYQIYDATNDALVVYSNEMNLTKDNSPMGRSSLLEVTGSDFGPILDFNNASMGGMKLSQEGLNKVMVNGAVHRVDMIIDPEAASQGIIKPDFRAFQRKEQADKEIKELGITKDNYKSINEIYTKYNLPLKYDENGQLNVKNYALFAVFDGTATTGAFEEGQRDEVGFSDFLKELGEQDKKNALQEFKAKDSKFQFDTGGWFSSGESIYRGSVFIPIKTNVLNSLSSNSLTMKQAMALDARSRQQEQMIANQTQSTYKNPKNDE